MLSINSPSLITCKTPLHATCLDETNRKGDVNNDGKPDFTHAQLVDAARACGMLEQGVNPNSLVVDVLQKEEWATVTLPLQISEAFSKDKSLGVFSSTHTSSYLDKYEVKSQYGNYFNSPYKQFLSFNQCLKDSRLPFFQANSNPAPKISDTFYSPYVIGVAREETKNRKQNVGITNIFKIGTLTATVRKDGLDFNGDGVTDYTVKPLNDDVIGYRFTARGNSYACPRAFGQYAARVIKHLKKYPDTDINQLNLFKFAFPTSKTYKTYQQWVEDGIRPGIKKLLEQPT